MSLDFEYLPLTSFSSSAYFISSLYIFPIQLLSYAPASICISLDDFVGGVGEVPQSKFDWGNMRFFLLPAVYK